MSFNWSSMEDLSCTYFTSTMQPVGILPSISRVKTLYGYQVDGKESYILQSIEMLEHLRWVYLTYPSMLANLQLKRWLLQSIHAFYRPFLNGASWNGPQLNLLSSLHQSTMKCLVSTFRLKREFLMGINERLTSRACHMRSHRSAQIPHCIPWPDKRALKEGNLSFFCCLVSRSSCWLKLARWPLDRVSFLFTVSI